MRIPFLIDTTFPLPVLAKSIALSTGIPPRALLNYPITGLRVDLAATMNLTGLFIIELINFYNEKRTTITMKIALVC